MRSLWPVFPHEPPSVRPPSAPSVMTSPLTALPSIGILHLRPYAMQTEHPAIGSFTYKLHFARMSSIGTSCQCFIILVFSLYRLNVTLNETYWINTEGGKTTTFDFEDFSPNELTFFTVPVSIFFRFYLYRISYNACCILIQILSVIFVFNENFMSNSCYDHDLLLMN